MASTGGVHSNTSTLSGTTADTCTMTGQGGCFAVTNHDTTNTLYFRYGSGTAAVAAADENFPVLPGTTLVVPRAVMGLVLSVVGNGGAYTVAIL